MAIAIDKMIEEFGALIDWREDAVATQVTTTDRVIVRNNPDRLGLTIMNLSGSNVFIRPSQAASAGTGILLTPQGGFMAVSVKDDGPLAFIEWHGLGSAVDLDIYVLEIIGVKSLT